MKGIVGPRRRAFRTHVSTLWCASSLSAASSFNQIPSLLRNDCTVKALGDRRHAARIEKQCNSNHDSSYKNQQVLRCVRCASHPRTVVPKVDVYVAKPLPSPRDQWSLGRNAKLNPSLSLKNRAAARRAKQEHFGLSKKSQHGRESSVNRASFKHRSQNLAAMACHLGCSPNRVSALAAPNQLCHPGHEQSWASGSGILAN